MPDDALTFLVRLQNATNAHDLETLVDCFRADYRNEAPAHPSRGFKGNDQVRTNWREIFGFVPDVQCQVLNHAVNVDGVWSEWEMSGVRLDGTRHHMRGVIIFGLEEGRAAWARFYLEPVDDASTTVDEAVLDQVRSRDAT